MSNIKNDTSVDVVNIRTVYAKLEELISIVQNLELSTKTNNNAPSINKHESQSTDKLNVALAKAQCEYPDICLNRKDQYLNNAYTDLNNIMVNIRPILGKNGISLTQRTNILDSTGAEDGKTFIETRIWHTSGQWIESLERFRPSTNNIDAYNSEINEIRKAQIMSLLNITIKNDKFDDNGYEVLKAEHSNAKEYTEDLLEPSSTFMPMTKYDVDQIEKELSFVPDSYRTILLKNLHVRTIADIDKNQLDQVLLAIRRNKESATNR